MINWMSSGGRAPSSRKVIGYRQPTGCHRRSLGKKLLIIGGVLLMSPMAFAPGVAAAGTIAFVSTASGMTCLTTPSSPSRIVSGEPWSGQFAAIRD
ncbi:hypothetical protein [Bradyrhizobium sp.]|uniref:hypothetical protein n=1 Tax=Bradyrhizobium sp. TaxID=376 RepID=UPI002CB62185|nr:hypothetical protein [Bradyrhizobium sp.]HMM89722.1 hypothetical protein [Bradyrhizobium sp.]